MAEPSAPVGAASGEGRFADLKVRVISGVVLAAAALVMTLAGPGPFAVLAALAGVLMAWEFGRIVRARSNDAAFLISAAAVLAGVVFTAFGRPLDALLAVLAAAPAVAVVSIGARPLLSAAGVLYAGLPVVALVWLRGDAGYGVAAVLFLILVTAATDIFAFFGGRTIGGPKLWPAVSPKKTWSGFLTGVGAAALTAALFAAWIGAPPLRLAALGLVLGALSQGGDLLESSLKRAFGVKDASNLIPGHGGVMDRMDGLVASAVAGAAVALMSGATGAPARALLFGA